MSDVASIGETWIFLFFFTLSSSVLELWVLSLVGFFSFLFTFFSEA
jgi:hypothetical protein